MKTMFLISGIAVNLVFGWTTINAAESNAEPYWETNNPVRIFDWDTLMLLQSMKVNRVSINADSAQKLISQLEKSLPDIPAAKMLSFRFERALWERLLSDGTTGKIHVSVKLELGSLDMLSVIRYVSELNGMTFSVKKGEVIFRPLLG